jgi:tRNA modification GTPase
MARTTATYSDHDTIVAPATAPGNGAVAIIRISGPDAHAIGDRLFRGARAERNADDRFTPGLMILGQIVSPAGELIDTGFRVSWRAPHSYTGEDVVELQVHGSMAIVRAVVGAAVDSGARLARPGEFTRRAFLNGRMDLAQAQAVSDLIQSETATAARAALAQLRGGLSARLLEVRASLVLVLAELEATVDFPEEGLEISTRRRLGEAVDAALRAINGLLSSADRGRVLREGSRVVLAGAPNAGKSSLFNLLVGRERAIVSPHPGTTRDTVEAQIELEGVAVTLVDTAGLRAVPEEIEAMGIARTHEEIRGAGLVLFVVDSTQPQEAVAEYRQLRDFPHWIIANKMDRVEADTTAVDVEYKSPGRQRLLALSSKTGLGFPDLESALKGWLRAGTGEGETPLVTHGRHVRALTEARRGLCTVAEGLASSLSPEFIALDLADAISRIDSITGHGSLDEEVLDAIFSTFCLGK